MQTNGRPLKKKDRREHIIAQFSSGFNYTVIRDILTPDIVKLRLFVSHNARPIAVQIAL